MSIDLRSDTVTRPSPGMRAAMMQAEVGDDVLGDDPTINALQARLARLLGKEAALFTPSGTMANQLGLRCQTEPGDEVLIHRYAHILHHEAGAGAALSGVLFTCFESPPGGCDASTLAPLRRPDAFSSPRTRLVALENTHNHRGGEVFEIDRMRDVQRWARGEGLRVHLDGARLWNAHVATGVPLEDYGREFDTVSVCLSKGLGAPVGSVLVGGAEAIAEARIWRKRFGGGMRQAGILAAAGLWALEHHIDRLTVDHARARRAAEAMVDAAPGSVDLATVETNIVIVDVAAAGWAASEFVTAALSRGVRSYAVSPRAVRLVWHLDVDDEATGHAIDVLTSLLTTGGRRSA